MHISLDPAAPAPGQTPRTPKPCSARSSAGRSGSNVPTPRVFRAAGGCATLAERLAWFAIFSFGPAPLGCHVPSKPESAQVFLSYATTDRERALAVGDALEAAGVSVWIDRRAIAGGDLWAAGIAQAIRQCAVVVVLCSQASVNSRNVRQELQLAWDFDRPILPLILEPIAFPDEIAYFLHGRQWIELLDQPDSTGVEAIASALASISVPTSDFNTRSRPEPMRFAPIRAIAVNFPPRNATDWPG